MVSYKKLTNFGTERKYFFTFASKIMKKAVAYIRSFIVKLWNVDVNIPLFLVFFIASILGLIDVLYRAEEMTATFSFVFICLLAVTKTMLAIWLLRFLKGKRHWLWLCIKGLTILFLVVYVLLCLINGISTILYGFGISHKLFIIAMETTANEVSGFLPSLWANIRGLCTAKTLIITILSIALVAVLMVLLKKRRLLAPILFIAAVAGVLGCGRMMTQRTPNGGYPFQRSSFFMTARIGLYWSHACESMNFIRELQSKVMPLPDADQLQRTRGCTNIVMVLGESALRDQWSLYGYPMDTSPCISAMADSLIVFNNAIGSSCSTADNVKHILTFKPDDPNETEWFRFPNIIDLFNTAGYYTSWISNQEICGEYSNFSYAVASHADCTQYIGSINSEDRYSVKYDDCLLPAYRKIGLDDGTPDFAVVHLIGSHTWYEWRFPASFCRFTAADVKAAFPDAKYLDDFAAQVVADYNNSLAYTDSLLKIMVDRVAVCPQPTAFVYFSDHGSNVYRDRYYDGRDRICARVPMFIYVNAPFRAAHPDIVAAMERAVDLPISTADIIHPFMTIAGITYPLYDATRDFLSPQFYPSVRYVDETPWEEDIAAGLPDRYAD